MAFNRQPNRSNTSNNSNNNRNTRAPGNNRGTAGSSNVQRSNPTDKMLTYARKIADELSVELPVEAETSFDACRAFIDANADSVPPTDKQLSLAQRLSESNGVDIPDDVLASKRKLSAWIDEQNGN